MINELKKSYEVIAFEANTGEDIKDFLKLGFTRIYADLKSYLGFFETPVKPIVLTSNQREFIKLISKTRFIDIDQLRAFVPEGLDALYLDYALILDEAVGKVSRIVPDILNRYTIYLGTLINFDDAVRDTKDFEKQLKLEEMNRLSIVEKFSGCFKKNSNVTETRLGKVVRRNSDWDTLFRHMEAMNNTIRSVDRTEIKKKITECSGYLDVLKKRIEEGSFKNASNESVKNIAALAYSVATELEFYSVVYYKVEALNAAINSTVQSVTTTLNQ